MPLTSKISMSIAATLTKAVTGFTDASKDFTWSYSQSLTTGTGINMSDRVFAKEQAVTAATPVDFDLSGSLVDVFGDALVFAEITAIGVKNLSTTAGQMLIMGGDAAAIASLFGAATHTIKIGPGGALCVANPAADAYAVTATSADILQFDASTGTLTFNLIVVGKSAA